MNLKEADELGTAVLRRIESDVPLSAVLPSARRFFSLVGDAALCAWVQLESTGLETDQRRAVERNADERIGALMFGSLRRAQQMSDFDLEETLRSVAKPASGDFPKRNTVMYQSTYELERMEMPDPLDDRARSDPTMVNAWAALRLHHVEARRILNLERQTLHRLVLERVNRVRDDRVLLDAFGPDANVVFSAAGSLLTELRSPRVEAHHPRASARRPVRP